MSMSDPAPYDAPKRRIDKAAGNKYEPPALRSSADSTAGMVFGVVSALCGCALIIMATVKIGFIWFT